MWAIKNFVCGPSASVTFGARPYPGALKQTANGHAATSRQPYRTLQCSTLVGGNVGIAYITYMVWAWGFRHAPGRPDVGNVGNVGNVFGVIKSLAKRRGLARKRPTSSNHITTKIFFLNIRKPLLTLPTNPGFHSQDV